MGQVFYGSNTDGRSGIIKYFKAIFYFLAAFILTMGPSGVWGQTNTPPAVPAIRPPLAPLEKEAIEKIKQTDKDQYLSFSYENDLIGNGTDQYYTSGVRLTYFNTNTDVPDFIDDIATALPGFHINAATSTFFTLGQNLFTPTHIRQRTADPDDRPWSAWLYGSVGLATLTNNHFDEFELTLGVIGPEALGEQTQKFIHRHVTDSPIPKGWSNQLDFEPGVILSWQRRWPRGPDGLWYADVGQDFRLNVQPSVKASVGNVYTYAGGGLMLTLGPHKDILQDTPPRVRPAMAGTGYFTAPDPGWNWYLFAGIDGRAVARNIFLDGNSFDDDSPSVDKKLLVADGVAGIAFMLDDYRLSYSANYRSKEFDGQPDDAFFGSITLTTRF